ncbi:MAG: nucleotide-binding protein [Actinobacteria bacterium]|nr:nucleotide-binding protein [Actinomycetota bacterium]
MKKVKNFDSTMFGAETLKESMALIESMLEEDQSWVYRLFEIKSPPTEWTFDTPEEFFAGYREHPEGAHLSMVAERSREEDGEVVQEFSPLGLHVWAREGYGPGFPPATRVEVDALSRENIESVFELFERDAPNAKVEVPEEKQTFTVFIGHGPDPAWRDLKDHLQDKHGIEVEAYEVGARAGHAIRDILAQMVGSSSFAILVMTGDDETESGGLRARQNVVHEIGLFQGALGFNRAIVAVERGIEEFSNLQGIQQLHFSSGNIREIFGDALATIRRESNSQ